MTIRVWKGMFAVVIFLPVCGSTGQAAQDQQQVQQQQVVQQQGGIEGVWDVTVTARSCATGAALFTGRSILMFIDGGTLTEIADRANRSTGLGTWRYVSGSSYTALEKFIDYTATGGFSGTEVITREIELNKNADGYTATATTQVYDAADQLINTVCATATATRFE